MNRLRLETWTVVLGLTPTLMVTARQGLGAVRLEDLSLPIGTAQHDQFNERFFITFPES
jgi:hypothetical protein